MPESIADLRIVDLLDVLFVAAVVFAGLRWLRTRARLVLIGLMLLIGMTLLVRQLGLQLTAWVLQGFVALAGVVVVVVFQDDLRRFFEQIGRWGVRIRPRRSPERQERRL